MEFPFHLIRVVKDDGIVIHSRVIRLVKVPKDEVHVWVYSGSPAVSSIYTAEDLLDAKLLCLTDVRGG